MIAHITLAKSSLLAAIPLVTIGFPIGGFVFPNASHPHHEVASFEKHKKTSHRCDTPQKINYTPRPVIGVDECNEACSPSDPNRCFGNTVCPNCVYSLGDDMYECQ
jgi:hypothetical protein